jgi:Ca2+:H+ antiporter
MNWLLVLAPISLATHLLHWSPLVVFATAAGAILPLAGIIGEATGELAIRAGPRIGGLLNATFGNVTELVIAVIFVVRDEQDVVKATITGSILGNALLVLGLSLFLGGLRHREQRYDAQAAGVHATSLMLAVVGLLMPALFVRAVGHPGFVQREVVSGVVAGVLIAVYVAALIFTLVTHQSVVAAAPTGTARWSTRKALAILFGATVLVALESELLVGALEGAVEALGVSKFFIGLILVPVVGNAAEHASAVIFARRDQLDVTLEIAIGSSIQIALFVAPVLVFIGLAVGHPIDFFFTPFEVAAVGLSTLMVAFISHDGRSNWLEGAQLLAAYAIMAVSFFFVPSP